MTTTRHTTTITAVENLERRLFLDATISGGVVTATGLAGNVNDTIVVSLSGSNLVVTHTATNHSRTNSFPLSSVTSIVLNGGDGNDTLEIQVNDLLRKNATLNGGNGNDTLRGGKGADTFNGGAGTDTADYSKRGAALSIGIGTVANDGPVDAAGNSIEKDNVKTDIENITGGSANDRITGSPAVNILRGGGGNDTINGGDANDQLFGDAGDDVLNGDKGADTLNGGDGNDRMKGGEVGGTLPPQPGFLFPDTFVGGNGSDTVDYSGRNDGAGVRFDNVNNDGNNFRNQFHEGDNVRSDVENAIGTSNSDELYGSAANNRLDGGGGADYIRANLNDQDVAGSAGTDTLLGGDGDDIIDAIFATGNKTLDGGNGNDRLRPGFGNDTIIGGAGVDTVDYGYRSKPLKITLGAPGVTTSDNGEDTATGGRAEDDKIRDVENATGGLGNDTITGNNSANILRGGGGNDTLRGNGAGDQLFGDAGNDFFFALDGVADQVFGGTGTDDGDFDAADVLNSVP